ncbi:MAG: hypothetical protein JWL93_390, partial [Hyphomicrobiales bacterium]|nr:hypothetical protein [Hyphomicrobiales bacterium]
LGKFGKVRLERVQLPPQIVLGRVRNGRAILLVVKHVVAGEFGRKLGMLRPGCLEPGAGGRGANGGGSRVFRHRPRCSAAGGAIEARCGRRVGL